MESLLLEEGLRSCKGCLVGWWGNTIPGTWWRCFQEDTKATASRHMKESLSGWAWDERKSWAKFAKEKTQEVIDLRCLHEKSLKIKSGAWIWSRAGWKISVTLHRGTTSEEELRMKMRVLEATDQQQGAKMNFGARSEKLEEEGGVDHDK